MKHERGGNSSLPTKIRRTHSALVMFLFVLLPTFAHAGTWLPFGPKNYVRGTGAPVTVTDAFTLLNPAAQYTLKAFNGGLQDNQTELVSGSVVTLNGVQVIGPKNFGQGVAEIDVPITPSAVNTISVQVRGQPGGVLAIEIVGVDNDPPSISASISPSPNAAGWNNSSVTVTFTCSDKTSGVAICPAPVSVTTEGANQVISGTAQDLAGNTASTSVTINLDETPPAISASLTPQPDASGWNSSAVTVNFNCSDALSGVASCPSPVAVTMEVTGDVITGTATDVAGNTASTSATVNISFEFFKIQSWQTGPGGNAKSPSGKCLDYGASPSGNGATVFLNDCSSAHPIRVYEIGPTPPNSPPGTLCISPRTGSGGTALCHEVMLFAGNEVIGVNNPQTITQGIASSPPQPVTEYQLEVQAPFSSPRGSAIFTAAQQIWRLDGDSIILEGSYQDPAGNVIPGPCINGGGIDVNGNLINPTQPCSPPSPPPQLVIQVQNARGANGSPLVAAVRNVSDNEFWDFVSQPGSRQYPTSGFQLISSPDGLWNHICSNPAAPAPPIPPTSTCASTGFTAGWGSVILVSSPVDCGSVLGPYPNHKQDIGGCVDLSNYPPIFLPAGVTIRGGRRGTNFGPQLYESSAIESLIFDVGGDYVRVSGLRLRGQSRSTDNPQPGGTAIKVESLPPLTTAQVPTTTQFVATVDHNDVSDWTTEGIEALGPFTNDGDNCSVKSPTISYNQPCPQVPVADDALTLGNVHVARNFIHHNQMDNLGYGVGTGGGGRAFIEGNTFDWNRHSIASDGEPHDEYRAAYNLVLSGQSTGDQEFDMHGTDCPIGHCGYGGTGGFYADIVGNTFLAPDRTDYWLRGTPAFDSDFRHNATVRNKGGATAIHTCFPFLCIEDSSIIQISPDNLFADSPSPYTDPTVRFFAASFGVGDFDGDGDDDLFLATGVGWYYSPAGAREWRFLNAAPDTIDQLLLGDFDGDGRTDVVAMRNGQLVVSWGGISAFELLNGGPLPCTSMSDMAVGDFDGDGQPDIFCADGNKWWVSFGGNTAFVQIQASMLHGAELRFGDFNGDGTTDVFSVQSSGWQVSYSPKSAAGSWFSGWQALPVSLTNTIDGLIVADFDGNGIADVLAPSSDGWQISYSASAGFTDVPQISLGGFPAYFGLAAVGHFTGQPQADVLIWNGVPFIPFSDPTELMLSAAGLSPVTNYSSQGMR